MTFRNLILLLLCLHFVKNNIVHAIEPANHLKAAFSLLEKSTTGAAELKRARDLGIAIETGPVSKTDITITKSHRGESDSYEMKTSVVIAEDKEPVFQALDLAHELVHATYTNKVSRNPFDPDLKATEYLKAGIEGEGGEAQSIATECKVGFEFIQSSSFLVNKKETVELIKARCQYVWTATEQDQSKWKNSFYHLGNYYQTFITQIQGFMQNGEEWSLWNDKIKMKTPPFASATAHKPYPVALLDEYVQITKSVCESAKAKLASRNIASVSESAITKVNFSPAQKALASRCGQVGVSLNP